ncbi:hypothetical protein DAPPUDRAFT_99995 [Daphnia pulex]|uniref:Uncharacterized protein n=1 Tax=Daphnia pulex TaxID=6669 RepID=E9G8Z6_DAPPU|nr:hypothetical protein DAPPUDRAFT_99995 [Daphnia pulex]|eukprot:EFX84184.1 hypothetical protein DAPPUDRAFT_99995 [Daphnia pulex]
MIQVAFPPRLSLGHFAVVRGTEPWTPSPGLCSSPPAAGQQLAARDFDCRRLAGGPEDSPGGPAALVARQRQGRQGHGGDDEPRLGSAPDPGPAERHPADDVAGHRLLLRAPAGLAHLPRSQTAQHAQRRLGLAGPGAGRLGISPALDGRLLAGRRWPVAAHRPPVADSGEGGRPRRPRRLAAGPAGPRLTATAPADQTHDEGLAGRHPLGRQGQSARPSAPNVAGLLDKRFRRQ